jgi:hypothetical protein
MGTAYGQVQIGVYKRGVRVALKLAERGHDIVFFCTGRYNFRDAETELAEEKMQFVDFTFQPARYEGAQANRQEFLKQLSTIQPDVVIIGEAPMAGTLLETTLCAVEAKIPVVLLDNAYHPRFVDSFCRNHGSMFDGIILSGTSALHGPTDYRYLAQVPPFIEASDTEARSFLQKLNLNDEQLMLVLAYDQKVEQLGISLLRKINEPELTTLFVASHVQELQKRLAELPSPITERTHVILPPNDQVLFGLLKIARCAITKCAFMQVTESMSLHTPVIGFYYEGDFSFDLLPKVMQSFSHTTSDASADSKTVAAARRFLHMDPHLLQVVHNGELEAASKTAAYLESMSSLPRNDTTGEVEQLGVMQRHLLSAIENLRGERPTLIHQVRANYLRKFPDHDLYNIVCEYSLQGKKFFDRFWARKFRTWLGVLMEYRRARPGESRRQVLHTSPLNRLLIEVDMGEESLPSIKELQGIPD